MKHRSPLTGTSDRLLLGKLGPRARILDFVTNGTVFMRRLEEFRGIENKAVGDPNEGLHRVVKPRRMWMRVEGTDEPFTAVPFTDATARLDSHFLQHAVYCMFGIATPPKPWFSALHTLLRHPDMPRGGHQPHRPLQPLRRSSVHS